MAAEVYVKLAASCVGCEGWRTLNGEGSVIDLYKDFGAVLRMELGGLHKQAYTHAHIHMLCIRKSRFLAMHRARPLTKIVYANKSNQQGY